MRLGLRPLIFASLTAVAAIAGAQNASPAARTSDPAPFPSRVLRQNTFNIPFTVETARQPLEVQLYLSRDRGQSWQLYARQNPSARFFPFHASQDGEYWFVSRTVEANRAPLEINGRQPELHVVIDTVQPVFDLQAVVGSSRQIQVSWRGSDPTLDPSSLKIEYQTGREQPWQPVAAEQTGAAGPTASGHLTFSPRSAWVELQVRAEISDLARNKSVITRRLALPAAARQPNPARPSWRPVATRSPNQPERPVALPPTDREIGRAVSATDQPTRPIGPPASGIPVDPYADARPSSARVPPRDPATSATTGSSPGASIVNDVAPTTEWKSTSTSSRPQRQDGAAAPLDQLVQGNGYGPQPSQVRPLVSQQITAAQPDDPPSRDATAPSPIRADSNRVPIKNVRMTSAMRFQVDYEFDAAAANGARTVELWGTRDQGQTWSRWKVDADRQSPLDVQVDGEGTFGFRIVIVGNNGLAGIAPRNGDDAEVWIGVDTTSPVVRIDTATYGEGEHAGKLAIHWTASDASFDEGPISILFSDQASGPWTTIAAGIPNSGQYFWPIDPRVPEQLFLRIEAVDQAGNKGEYRLPGSVNLSGFTPKARIRGIRPLPDVSAEDSAAAGSAPHARRNPYTFR